MTFGCNLWARWDLERKPIRPRCECTTTMAKTKFIISNWANGINKRLNPCLDYSTGLS